MLAEPFARPARRSVLFPSKTSNTLTDLMLFYPHFQQKPWLPHWVAAPSSLILTTLLKLLVIMSSSI